MVIVNFLMNHPALFLFALPLVPAAIAKAEKIAINRLLASGDVIDQEAIRDTLRVWVRWAEKKGAQNGAAKFAAVDRIVARIFPFLSAEQRKDLIENAVKQMDQAAGDAIGGNGGGAAK